MERSIIHLNIADFAATVETNDAPCLKGHPIIIAPTGAPRAVVYDMSEQAYREGVRKGMPLARARRINKKMKLISPRFNRYNQVMQAIFKQSLAYTPAIEIGGWDGHMFLDVTGTNRLFGPPADLAFRLKRQMKKSFGLNPIWSLATNKLVAKVATRLVKPAGEYIVAPGEESAFLEPLPITLLPGLSRAELIRLKRFNLYYISQLLPMTLEQLQIPFDSRAVHIHHLIRGIDPTPVTRTLEKDTPEKGAPVKDTPIQADHEFSEDTNDAQQLKKATYLLVEALCFSLRQRQRSGSLLSLTISYSDGRRQTAGSNLIPPTANELTMFKNAILLLFKAWTRRIRIRHIRLICKRTVRPDPQSTLFSESTKADSQEKVFKAMDKIRKKFGTHSVKTGLTLARTATKND